MKKVYLVFVIVTALFLYGCNKDNETTVEPKKENSTKVELQDKKLEEKTDENKDTKNQEKTQVAKKEEKSPSEDKKSETKKLSLIYFDETISIIWGEDITLEQVNNYINNEAKEKPKNNTPYIASVQDGKIVSMNEEESIEITGKYIGLSDAKVAEFSHNSNEFRLEITPGQSEQLEEISENDLLSLKVEKSNQEGGNLKLIEFSPKKEI